MITPNAVHLGPLMLPWIIIIPVLGIFCAILISGFYRKSAEISQPIWEKFKDSIWGSIIIGLLIARLVFIGLNFQAYSSNWIDIIKIQDHGFEPFSGFIAAFIYFLFKNKNFNKKILVIALSIFIAINAVGFSILKQYQKQYQIFPELSFMGLDNQQYQLNDFRGKPIVINLWASWCPPCRKEMPLLSDAQIAHKNVNFLFINQGEDAEAIQQYLDKQNIKLHGILLDKNGELAQKTGLFGLPSTLFFDAKGNLVTTHMGEISHAVLEQKLKSIQE